MEPDINSAIKKGYLQQVRFQLELGSSPNCRDEERRTPLMNCALIDDESWGVGVARTLIEKGAVMALKCRRGMNVLHYACIYGRNDLMEVLLRSADLDIVQGDRQGNTPLHYAAAKGHEPMVKTLIQTMRKYHLGLDKVNNLGFTALMQAWRGGHELCAKTLLSRGADVTPRDYVELKSAQDYEEDFRKQQQQQGNQQKQNKRQKGFFFNLPQYRRPFSAMSYVSGSSQSTRINSASIKTRPASANLLERRRGARGEKTKDEVIEEDYLKLAERDRAAGKMIHCASRTNLRNKPEQLLNISPMECFVKETRYQLLRNPSSLSLYAQDQNNTAFKSEVKKMYTVFQFQFSKSYCRPAHPREPEPVTNDENRGVSPNPSDYDGERNKKARKSSGKITLTHEEKLDRKARKASAKSHSRKSSIASSASLKSQLDCFSNDNVSGTSKSTRKRNTSDNNDATEPTHSDKNGKVRSRKLSASIEDHLTMINQSIRTTSRDMTIPVVNEPVGQDQLGAIRE